MTLYELRWRDWDDPTQPEAGEREYFSNLADARKRAREIVDDIAPEWLDLELERLTTAALAWHKLLIAALNNNGWVKTSERILTIEANTTEED